MKLPDIIEFDPQYTDQVKSLLSTVLQSLDLPKVPEIQRSIPDVIYDDCDLDRITELYTQRSRFWLALVGNEVVGMVAIAEADDTVALLRRMFVATTYQGTEVGARLLDIALEFAEAQGFQTIELDTHVGMKRAHAFYEKHGFRKTAENEQQRHYTLDLQ